MNTKGVEAFCLALPAVTRHTPWGESAVFKVGNKMFAMIAFEDRPKPDEIWFKAGDASFAILTKVKGIRPCPYLARAQWVAVEGFKPLSAKELKAYLTRAHALVAQGLTRKTRTALGLD